MNTTRKGDLFEEKSFKLIEAALSKGTLGVMPEYARIFSKKGYYSYKRKSNIIFDIAIEVWPPGADRFSLVYFIECKDYSHRVPVDDIEEFSKKISQVSGINAKAIFITSASFQEGAYNIAESEGIMLISAQSETDYKILLYKIDRYGNERQSLEIKKREELVYSKDVTIETIIERAIYKAFTSDFTQENIKNSLGGMSKKDLDAFVEAEWAKIDPQYQSRPVSLTTEKLIQFLNREYGIAVNRLSSNTSVLGMCDAQGRKIKLNPALKGSDRCLFVLAHEFGHYILHRDLKITQDTYESFDDSEFNFRTNKYDLKNIKHWIEWQANYFASSLVMPRVAFIAIKIMHQKRNGWPQGKIFLDDQVVNRTIFFELIKKIAYSFSVSKTSVLCRLRGC